MIQQSIDRAQLLNQKLLLREITSAQEFTQKRLFLLPLNFTSLLN
jgi:hypothetical protein